MTKFDANQVSRDAPAPNPNWIYANRRACLMTTPQLSSGTLGGLYYKQFENVSNLTDLINACVAWKATSWPLVVAIVSQTNFFATLLSDFVDVVKGGRGNLDTLKKLVADATAIQTKVGQFVTQAGAFHDVNLAAENDGGRGKYSSSTTYHDLDPDHPNAVSDALTAIGTEWNGPDITGNMGTAIQDMQAAETNFGDPQSKQKLADANTAWGGVVQGFQQSPGDMNAAANELTGQAAYENNSVEEDKLYYVRLARSEPTALTVQSDGSLVVRNFQDGASNQQWRFTNTGYGWFLLTSADPAFANKAATSIGGSSMAMTPIGHGSAEQNYRIVQVDDKSLRIANLQCELLTDAQRALKEDTSGNWRWEYLVIEGQDPPPPSYLDPKNQMWNFSPA